MEILLGIAIIILLVIWYAGIKKEANYIEFEERIK